MEKSTSLTFLYHSTTADGAFSKLVDITSYPDMGSAPEKLDVSDLSSNQKKYEPGMVDVPDMEFGFNYIKARYDALKAMEGTKGFFQLRFGENGEYGAWQWSGKLAVTASGGQVGGARQGKVTMYPDSDIVPVSVGASAPDPDPVPDPDET